MYDLTSEGQHIVSDVAQRHGVSTDAVLALLHPLVAGHGTMAQFNHPELGGMGQWTQGGMTMVGNMFDHDLKARVDALCTELASLLHDQPSMMVATASRAQQWSCASGMSPFVAGGGCPSETWWPSELGPPSTAGSQNDLRYAIFPAAHRLAIEQSGRVTLYDTGNHLIFGVSQHQRVDQSLTFTSQHGPVRFVDLPVVEAGGRSSTPDTPPEGSASQPHPEVSLTVDVRPKVAPASAEDVLERLAELHKKGVLTDEEFAAKKTELLTRI